MGKPKTIRFEEQLEPKVNEYVEKNGMKLNQLVNLAVKKFITETNTIELEPVDIDDESWNKTMKKAFKNNRKAMDELA